MTPRTKGLLTLAISAVVGIMPAWFGYLANRDELKAKYRQSQTAAEGSYETLAASVKELQVTAVAQHDYIVKLEARLEANDTLIAAAFDRANAVTASGHRVTTAVTVGPRKPPPARPLPPPTFGKLPDNIDAVMAERPAAKD